MTSLRKRVKKLELEVELLQHDVTELLCELESQQENENKICPEHDLMTPEERKDWYRKED